MTREEFIDLLQRYETGKCSPTEIAWVEQWYQALSEEESRDIESQVENRIWKRIEVKRKPLVRKVVWLAAAVVLLTASAVLYVNYNSSTRIEKWSGQMATIENTSASPVWYRLADGSSVQVWPHSKLSIEMNARARKVNLQGYAFFNVDHQIERPFYVVTSNLVTNVLGTSFYVDAASEKQFVSVKTGLVKVSSPKSKTSVNVLPNQKAVYDPVANRLIATLVEKPQRDTSGRLYFEKTPVAEIFDCLAKTYRLNIQYDKKKLTRCRLTSEVGSEDFFTVLKALCLAINGSYAIDGTTIVITNVGC